MKWSTFKLHWHARKHQNQCESCHTHKMAERVYISMSGHILSAYKRQGNQLFKRQNMSLNLALLLYRQVSYPYSILLEIWSNLQTKEIVIGGLSLLLKTKNHGQMTLKTLYWIRGKSYLPLALAGSFGLWPSSQLCSPRDDLQSSIRFSAGETRDMSGVGGRVSDRSNVVEIG